MRARVDACSGGVRLSVCVFIGLVAFTCFFCTCRICLAPPKRTRHAQIRHRMVDCLRGLIGTRSDWLPALQFTDPLTNQPTRSSQAMFDAVAQSEAAGLARVITGATNASGMAPSQKVGPYVFSNCTFAFSCKSLSLSFFLSLLRFLFSHLVLYLCLPTVKVRPWS